MKPTLNILIAAREQPHRALIKRILQEAAGDKETTLGQTSEVHTISKVKSHLIQEEFPWVFLDQDLFSEFADPIAELEKMSQLAQEKTTMVVLINAGAEAQIPKLLQAGAWEVYPRAELTPTVISLLFRSLYRDQISTQRIHQLTQQLQQTESQGTQQRRQLAHQSEQLKNQEMQLLQAAQLKSQFLATTSHELRTPLNAIIGFSQILLWQSKGQLNENQRTMVQRILNNGHQLLTLLNDILDLSKIESGHLTLNPESFDFLELVKTTVDELRPLAEQKQLCLTLDLSLNDFSVIHDRSRLHQILSNLITNGIKYTEQGYIQIAIREQEQDQLLIQVQDTGIGIHPAQLPLIFEAFRQLDQSDKRKHSGTGLGLAIVYSLVQMMQGQIEVESSPGQGSTFQIRLPKQYPGMRISRQQVRVGPSLDLDKLL